MKRVLLQLLFGLLIFVLSSAIVAAYGCGGTECGAIPRSNCVVHQNTTFNPGVYNIGIPISICANNVVLDCNGTSLVGEGSGTGIFISTYESSTIKNCNLIGYSTGIHIQLSRFNTLINNKANIYIWGSDFNNLTNNAANNIYAAQNGIYLLGSNFNTLIGNTAYGIRNADSGFRLGGSNNNTLIGNTANSNAAGIIVGYGSDNIFINNTANYGLEGISLYNSDSNTLIDNTANLNTFNGFRIFNSSGNTVNSNTFCFNNESNNYPGRIGYDAYNAYGSPNLGWENTCKTTFLWNDTGVAGCTYLCTYVIITNALPLGLVGVPYSFSFEARGGIPPYAWSLVSGTLPSGTNFYSNGILNGTPREGGTFHYFVRAVDANNTIAEKEFIFDVLLTIPPTELQVQKTSTAVAPGRDVDYFIVAKNVGRFPVQNSKISEFIEPWFTFGGSDPPPFNITNFTRATSQNRNLSSYEAYIEWNIPALEPNEIRLIAYRVKLDQNFPVGEQVRGQACMTFTEAANCRTLLLGCIGGVMASCSISPPPFWLGCVLPRTIMCESGWVGCMTIAGSPLCGEHRQTARRSFDPNEKVFLAERFIQSNQTLPYVIHFENIGNADAQNIFINDTLAPTLDQSTLQVVNARGSFTSLQNLQTITLLETNRSRLINISIGNQTIIINQTHVEQWNVTLRAPTLYWTLSNIYLLPNATSQILYSVKPASGLPSGTEIRNKATIQFEIFESLETNETLNVVDDIRPSCSVNPLLIETRNLTFFVSWNGTDQVGEIAGYAIFVSEQSGPYQLTANNTLQTNMTFTGVSGRSYGFICIATDTAGNTEIQAPVAEVSTRIPGADLQSLGIPRIGTTVNFSISDWTHPGKKYILAMSLGTSPGIPLGDGRVIPLNPGIVFLLSIQGPSLIGLRNSINLLNEQGQGTTYWDIPNVPELNGVTVYAAFVVLDHTLPIPFASMSNAVPIQIV